MPEPATPALATLLEESKRLKVHERTLRKLIAKGAIPAVRVGHQWRLNPEEVDKALQGHCDPVAALLERSLEGRPLTIEDETALRRVQVLLGGGVSV